MYNFGNFISDNMLKDVGLIEVGIINGKLRKQAKSKGAGLKSVGNMQARKIANKDTKQSTADVLEVLDNKLGILDKPLDKNNSSEYKEFIECIVDYANYKSTITLNRLKNSLKVVIIKPIAKSIYGSNAQDTAKRKGFNKLMVDTAQTIKAIEVSVNGN